MNKLTLFVILVFLGFNNFCSGQCSSGQTTSTFSFTGDIEQFVVPDGVTDITMTVTGADGGGDGTYSGGSGGTAKATFTVTSGEILDVVVGQAGSSSPSITLGAGGGGGGSGVRRNSTSTILIIGGGGGGGGADGLTGGNTLFQTQNTLSITQMGGNGRLAQSAQGGDAFNGVGGSCSGCFSGGFGAGGGGAGDLVAGGGGGGIGGPFGSNFLMIGGVGGSSYINSLGSMQLFTNGVADAGTESNGSVTFCYALPFCNGTDISGLQPPIISFIESTCDNNGVASGGSVVPPTAEIASLASFGNTLQFFDFASNSWTTTLPTYNQSEPITVRVRVACTSDLTQTGVVRDFISNPASCTLIPTMSQWGLMIFGLLTINIGVVLLRRKEEILS